ncbi:PAS domain-containing protein [Actinacidiphila glaucinigra]|uniref:PAS domain-containing protein n=1 Tax=Actinacidiphila glaucinigra TaxID=235986 RepID=UPI002DDB7B7C|nr:PAS domain-containing protein [Actinacidiphila glaucinigra]
MGSTTGTATPEAHEAPAPGGAATALLDAEGAVAGWSQAAQRLVGYSAAEMVGRPARALLLDGDVRGRPPRRSNSATGAAGRAPHGSVTATVAASTCT